MCTFEVKHDTFTPKDVKLSALQYGYLGFFIFFDFHPKTQNVDLKKINAYKEQNLRVIKNGIYVVSLHSNNPHTKFQSDICILGCAMLKQKQVKVMTSLFGNAISGISDCRT